MFATSTATATINLACSLVVATYLPNLPVVLDDTKSNGDSRVEAGARDRADTDSAAQNGGANGQTVPAVVLSGRRRRNAQNNVTEDSGEDALREESLNEMGSFAWSGGNSAAANDGTNKSASQPAEDLGDPVHEALVNWDLAAKEDGKCDGRVDVGAGDRSHSVHNGYETQTDRQRGQRGAGQHSELNDEDEEHGAEKLGEHLAKLVTEFIESHFGE